MPQITRLHVFGIASFDQLSKHGFHKVAHTPQDRTPTVRGSMFCCSKRSQQQDSHPTQVGFQGGQPIVAVSQQQARSAFRQVIGHLSFVDIGDYQFHLSNHPRSAHSRMNSKTIQGLLGGLPLLVLLVGTLLRQVIPCKRMFELHLA